MPKEGVYLAGVSKIYREQTIYLLLIGFLDGHRSADPHSLTSDTEIYQKFIKKYGLPEGEDETTFRNHVRTFNLLLRNNKGRL
jgi:hypothetical protein